MAHSSRAPQALLQALACCVPLLIGRRLYFFGAGGAAVAVPASPSALL
jgi:hypothetical protein